MKYHYIDGNINNQTVEKLAEFLNDNDGVTKSIFLNSQGGGYSDSRIIGEMLGRHKGFIELIAMNEIGSAAFEIFFLFEGAKRMGDQLIGVYHLGGAELLMGTNGRPITERDRVFLGELEKMNDCQMKFCKQLGMKESEIKKIKKGDDVYFIEERLKEFMINSEINNL